MMFYKNNWFTWRYDNIPYNTKPRGDAVWNIDIKKTVTRSINSYKQELLLNAQLIRDIVSGPIDLMFSGGLDSEIVLRCYLELGIPINVITFRYENDYNIRDYYNAMRICKELNVVPKVIDFNLKSFFENDAYDIWIKALPNAAGRLPHMKMLDYLDNFPVMCDGFGAYSDSITCEENKLLFNFNEAHYAQSLYAIKINRQMISHWYEYSPELILAWLELPEIQNFKSNYNVTKHHMQKNIWPDVVIREKLRGFEGPDDSFELFSSPTFMKDFYRKYIKGNVKITKYTFGENQFKNLLSSTH